MGFIFVYKIYNKKLKVSHVIENRREKFRRKVRSLKRDAEKERDFSFKGNFFINILFSLYGFFFYI